MKNITLSILTLFTFGACEQVEMEVPVTTGGGNNPTYHSKGVLIKEIMEKYVHKGIPGIVVAIKDAEGYYQEAIGYAKLEDKTSMDTEMLQYGFSITKMLTAISIMQLKEAGKIILDKPINTYLPQDALSVLDQTDIITVRMLLNQTSGYNDYVRVNEFSLRWMDNPLKIWTKADYFDLIKRKVSVNFIPGSDFLYSNTNYYLLALIIDEVTGKPHGEWYQEKIFDIIGLNNMFYKNAQDYPFYTSLPNVYAPKMSNGKIENISRAQLAWMQNEEYGTTGILATPDNYIKLLEGLVKGSLVSETSLSEMKAWVTGKNSSEPDYGFGLIYLGYQGKPNFGHDGDGIGASALLLYFPEAETFLFIASNSSTEFGGSMQMNISSMKNDIANSLAEY